VNDLFKKPITIIIVVVAILIAVGWSLIEKQVAKNKAEEAAKAVSQATVTVTNLSNIDPAEFDESVKNEYATANSKAMEADPKNVFSALVVELPGNLAVASGNDRYIFSSATNVSNNWTITLSQKTGSFIRAVIPKDDYLGVLKPMDTKLWKFNYVTALQIAEKNGGKEWREKNNAQSVTLTLMHQDTNNWLVWTVEYAAESNKFIVKIDSNSGKVLE